jgi:hypothetical protein
MDSTYRYALEQFGKNRQGEAADKMSQVMQITDKIEIMVYKRLADTYDYSQWATEVGNLCQQLQAAAIQLDVIDGGTKYKFSPQDGNK